MADLFPVQLPAAGSLTVGDTLIVQQAGTPTVVEQATIEKVLEVAYSTTTKTTPIAADTFTFFDSVSSTIRKLTWTNLISALGTTFAALAGSASQTFSGATATSAAHFTRLDQLSVDLTNLPIYSQGSFTVTLVGCTTSPTQVWYWTKNGKQVTISPSSSALIGTSNATTKTLTGLPATLYPVSVTINAFFQVNNAASYTVGLVQINPAGVITVYPDVPGNAWVNPGTIGIVGNSFSYCTN